MLEARVDPTASGHVFGAPTGDYMGLTCFRNGSLAREQVRDRFGLSWDEFSRALARTPGDAYATLERGVIASALGDRQRALKLLDRAAHLNPRDPLTRKALALLRAGKQLSVVSINRAILGRAQQFH